MHHQLAAIVQSFEEARSRARRLADQTPEARWAERRDPARWSVAECIAHLNLTSQAYLPLLRASYTAHPATPNTTQRYRRDVIGWMLGYAVGPMPRIGRARIGRMPTTPTFVPQGQLERGAVMAEFESCQDAQVELVNGAEGRPLNDMWLISPFNARVKYNAYSCLVLLPRHQHRHLDQAGDVWR